MKYVPECCKGDNPSFSGEVELRFPTFDEKYELLESSGVEIGDSGEVDVGGKTKAKFALIRKMVSISKPFYVTVALKNLESGEELKSFEDLSADPDAHEILIEIAGRILNGKSLGK